MKEYIVSETLPGAIRTLPEAFETVKANEKELKKNEIVRIVIHGTQHLSEPLHITAEDLPGPEHPVFVDGADENAGFSGGMQVQGFTHWKNNIWRVKLPKVEYTRHLYIDGKSAKRPATESRQSHCADVLQAEDYEFISLPGEEVKTLRYNANYPGGEIGDQPADNGGCPISVIEIQNWSGIATTHTEIAEWRNTRDLEMVFEVSWVHRVVPIERVQFLPDSRLYIKPVEPAFTSARTMEGVRIGACPNYIENVFELLGKPLEWYFDRTEQMLYVGFEEGDTPDNHEIVIPLVEQLLEVKGDLNRQPCHLCFRNLQFSYTTWLFPREYGVPEVQANQMKFSRIPKGLVLEKPYEADYQKVISALRILAAKDISFEDCSFTALGTGALQYEYGAQDCRIIGNHFYEIGGSAVSMGDFYLERAHHPEDRREIVRGIEIRNNYIHDTGRDFRGSAAILAGYVQDVTIAHNDIHDVPYSAISLGWGWGWADVSVGPKVDTPWKEPSVCMRNRILNNHIHHCMMQLHDGGAIYTIGAMTGTIISGNYIHESAGYQGEGYQGGDYNDVLIHGYQTEGIRDPEGDFFWNRHGVPGGIYLDEGSTGIEVCSNVLHDVAVPLFYHNQIDLGYTRVQYRENVLNKKPGNKDFPIVMVECAGREPAYREKRRL